MSKIVEFAEIQRKADLEQKEMEFINSYNTEPVEELLDEYFTLSQKLLVASNKLAKRYNSLDEDLKNIALDADIITKVLYQFVCK